MSLAARFERLLQHANPLLALAPMQDVTTLPFWNLLQPYGGPDIYVTEYFRVHSVSRLDRRILKGITDNPTGRMIIAQIIGNDISALVRTARQLQQYPILAVDFNLGCPAPYVCRKAAGGGLLRDPERIDAILGALRDAIQIKFTVKTRLGFNSVQEWEPLLSVFAKHSLDLLIVHGRLVSQMYSGEVHYNAIAQAARTLPFPVIANGDISSAAKAQAVLRSTGAKGLMLGRGAVRNPWLFTQIRQHIQGLKVVHPTGREVLEYMRNLYHFVCAPGAPEKAALQRMKKYLTFIGPGIDPTGQVVTQAKHAPTTPDFFRVCDAFLNHNEPMLLEALQPPTILEPKVAEPTP